MEWNWLYFVVAPLIGFVGMLSGGYWGIGCSWLIVPVMLLFGLTPMETAGVALLQMVPAILPVVIRDAPALGWDKREFGRTLILPLGIGGVMASFLGRPVNVFLYHHFGEIAFGSFFSVFMLFLGAYILLSRPRAYGVGLPVFGRKEAFPAFCLGAVSGFLSALLGIGGGMLYRPLLAGYFKVPEKESANAVRLLLFLTALAGGLFYVFWGHHIQWPVLGLAALVAIGGALGFPYGVRIHRIVLENGYAQHIHKSFALAAVIVVINMALKMGGYQKMSAGLMVILAIWLMAYLICFAAYARRHPKAKVA